MFGTYELSFDSIQPAFLGVFRWWLGIMNFLLIPFSLCSWEYFGGGWNLNELVLIPFSLCYWEYFGGGFELK